MFAGAFTWTGVLAHESDRRRLFQVLPMEDINLHLQETFMQLSGYNLLAAVIDNHIAKETN